MKNIFSFFLALTVFNVSAQMSSTGTHSETIPIYTVQEGNLAVPISISYDASGVKVSSIASSVGQNWSLNAGGKISRIVRDKPDEMYETFENDIISGQLFTDYTGVSQHLVMKDTEKDIFILQLNGQSISFVLDKLPLPIGGTNCYQFKYNALLLNDTQDIKIELLQFVNACTLPPPNDIVVQRWNDVNTNKVDQFLDTKNGGVIRYFRATTPDGTQYYFGETVEAREYTFTYKSFEEQEGLCSATTRNMTYFNSPTSWMLTRIVFPKGNSSITGGPNLANSKYQEINFKYKRTQSLIKNIKSNVPFTIYSKDCVPIQSAETDHRKKPLSLNSELSKIESENFVIDFNSNYVFSLANTMTNTSIIDNFSSTSFTAKRRLDIESISEYAVGLGLPSTINCFNSLGQNVGSYANPFVDENILPKAEILKNILVTDKISNKKIAFYFNHDYYSGYVYNTNTGTKSTFATGRLKLKGIYQIKLGVSNEIQPGYSFTYNNEPLPDYTSFAQDHWGYYNGNDDNEIKSGLIELPSSQIRSALGITIFGDCLTKVSSNLSVNESLAQAGILTKLKFPTGGEVSYTYQSHESDNYFSGKELVNSSITKVNEKKIGGLRIANISTFDPVSNSTYYKKYTYLKENSTESSGIITILPTYAFTFTPTSNITGTGCIIPNQSNELVDRFIHGGYIYYRRIKEESYKIVDNAPLNEGYVTYEYYSQNNASTIPYQIFDSNTNTWKDDDNTVVGLTYTKYRDSKTKPISDPLNGILTKIKIYNNVNTLLSESNFQYSPTTLTKTINQGYFSKPHQVKYKTLTGQCTDVPLQETNVKSINNPIPSMVISTGQSTLNTFINNGFKDASSLGGNFVIAVYISTVIQIINSIAGPIDCSDYLTNSNLIDYNLPLYRIRKNNEISTKYDITGANPVTTTTEYSYDLNNSHRSPIKVKQTFSNSNDIIESYVKYSSEYFTSSNPTSDEEVLGLRTVKERNMFVPIESYIAINGKVIGGTYTQYHSSLGYEGLPSKIWSLELENPITNYAPSNIPSILITPEMVKNSQYVPKTIFTTYNAKGLLASSNGVELVGTNVVNMPNTYIDYTHNNLIPSSITSVAGTPLSRTTTFETIPLFGRTKVTNPNNDIITKEYDELGRLKFIKDKDGNILKSYIYNVKF